MKQPASVRSIRIKDDIWEELSRLRVHPLGVGGPKSWDQLLNYFLILHHGNGDWRTKVEEVDNVAYEEWACELKGKGLSLEEMSKLYYKIEDEVYKKFVKKQSKELNKRKS
jgi:hypothetical protein